MNNTSRNIDILKTRIAYCEHLTFFQIAWDTIKKEYVLGLRYDGPQTQPNETLYLDFVSLFHIYCRLPEAMDLLRKFNNHHNKPVKNSDEAIQLVATTLEPPNQFYWHSHKFVIPVYHIPC